MTAHWFSRRRSLIRSRAPEPTVDLLMRELRETGWSHDGDAAIRRAAKGMLFVKREVKAGRISDQTAPDEPRRGDRNG